MIKSTYGNGYTGDGEYMQKVSDFFNQQFFTALSVIVWVVFLYFLLTRASSWAKLFIGNSRKEVNPPGSDSNNIPPVTRDNQLKQAS